MKSILQKEKECFVCGTTYNLNDHHIFFGTANRKQSEKYGMKVWLCQEHHTGSAGVHFNKPLDIHLKKLAQMKFESVYGANTRFIDIFGKTWL